MNNKLLIQILLHWSIENYNFYMTIFLYKTFNVGIPYFCIYNLRNKTSHFTLDKFVNPFKYDYLYDKNLQDLYKLFKKSKYKKLDEWDNLIGYILIDDNKNKLINNFKNY